MQAQMEGFGTAGFALSIFGVLLGLAQPIKSHAGIDSWCAADHP